MKWKGLKARNFRPESRRRRNSGQGSAEFALVLPVIITLIFGVMQFGYALYDYSFVVYAARSAARYAMMHSSLTATPATSSSITNWVKGIAVGMDQTQITVTSTWTPSSTPGGLVKVQVSYPFKPFTAYLPSANINLSSTMQMTIVY